MCWALPATSSGSLGTTNGCDENVPRREGPVTGLCRGVPGERCGKRRKWLIHIDFPRRRRSLNPLVEGSNPSGPTNSINGLAKPLGRWAFRRSHNVAAERIEPACCPLQGLRGNVRVPLDHRPVPWTSFTRIVQRYSGNAGVRGLACAEQFRAMAFAQLTWRESLRDIDAATRRSVSLSSALH